MEKEELKKVEKTENVEKPKATRKPRTAKKTEEAPKETKQRKPRAKKIEEVGKQEKIEPEYPEEYKQILNFVKTRKSDEDIADVIMDLIDDNTVVQTALLIECMNRLGKKRKLRVEKKVYVHDMYELYDYSIIKALEKIAELDEKEACNSCNCDKCKQKQELKAENK